MFFRGVIDFCVFIWPLRIYALFVKKANLRFFLLPRKKLDNSIFQKPEFKKFIEEKIVTEFPGCEFVSLEERHNFGFSAFRFPFSRFSFSIFPFRHFQVKKIRKIVGPLFSKISTIYSSFIFLHTNLWFFQILWGRRFTA